MALPTIASGISAFGILYLIFRKELSKPIDNVEVLVEEIQYKTLTIIALIFLLGTTILLAISNFINLEMWLITLISSICLSIILIIFGITKKDLSIIRHTYTRIPWNLAVFVFSMFVLVLTLNYNNVFESIQKLIYSLTRDNKFFTVFSYGIESTLSDNIINNIPMSLAFSCIIKASQPELASIYATIIGSNLGAYLSPIGALAGIMWMSILKKEKVNYSFMDFTKEGIIITFPVLLVSLLILAIIL